MLINKLIRDKSKYIRLGLIANGSCYLSFCQNYYNDKEKKQCQLVSCGYFDHSTPIITINQVIHYKKQRLRCKIHKVDVDIFDENFILNDNDDYNEETKDTLFNDNNGIVKYGYWIFSWSVIKYIWSIFIATKKISLSRKYLIILYRIFYQQKYNDDDEYIQLNKLQRIFKLNGILELFEKLIENILPSRVVFRNLLKDIGYSFAIPLYKQHKIDLSYLSTRWIGYDATFRVAQCIQLKNYKKTRVALLTVTDEWGNWTESQLLPKCSESHKYIIPVLAMVVYRSLYYGIERDEHFMFCSDNAVRDIALPQKVFVYLINNINNKQIILQNKDKKREYNLQHLGENAKVK